MTPNDTLLAAIRARGQKQTEFGHGIQTADVFVRTLAERIGLDSCYKYVGTRRTSFDDLLQKAGRTLVYSNPDMQIEEKDVDQIRKDCDRNYWMDAGVAVEYGLADQILSSGLGSTVGIAAGDGEK